MDLEELLEEFGLDAIGFVIDNGGVELVKTDTGVEVKKYGGRGDIAYKRLVFTLEQLVRIRDRIREMLESGEDLHEIQQMVEALEREARRLNQGIQRYNETIARWKQLLNLGNLINY